MAELKTYAWVYEGAKYDILKRGLTPYSSTVEILADLDRKVDRLIDKYAPAEICLEKSVKLHPKRSKEKAESNLIVGIKRRFYCLTNEIYDDAYVFAVEQLNLNKPEQSIEKDIEILAKLFWSSLVKAKSLSDINEGSLILVPHKILPKYIREE